MVCAVVCVFMPTDFPAGVSLCRVPVAVLVWMGKARRPVVVSMTLTAASLAVS